ncbi:alpha/beta hydrolase [Spectribacter hydrogenoxidans]|uniref:Alpha/beta hydrolase n=1 Tax=Spectribacter hydrogenoxidans TaxID=3075608 RepID=A0ABU3C234_9GAMM|nr:alpha/beta hydrolase [Salinisphaera sp. W335]MDT0635602.1 alpha/beta hydrolase [Salinisphaera sp. W335]
MRRDRPTVPRMILTLLLAGGAAFLLLAGCMFVFQERLLFMPNTPGRDLRATPADVGLAYEDVHLETTDGETLHGWYVPAPDAKATLLHFHGNAGNIGDRIDLLALFHHIGLSVLTIDYRGYGQSTGKPSEPGTYRDAEAAWSYLVERRRIPPDQIILHGQSLGGAVAAWLATKVEPAGLILDSTFTSVPDIAGEVYPWLPVRQLARLSYNTLDRIPDVDIPILVLHSREDDIIGFHHGERLAEAAGARLVALRGGHNETMARNQAIYQETFLEFVAAVLRGPD